MKTLNKFVIVTLTIIGTAAFSSAFAESCCSGMTAMPACPMLAQAAGAPVAQDKGAVKVKPYTLKTCIVSGEKLGEMGAPYTITNGNREIKLCCKGCLKDFEKKTDVYLKKIDEAEKAAAEKAASASEHQHLH